MLISVIVTTYNKPEFLKLVLLALANQDDTHFEVIVADDGSTKETADLIHSLQLTFPVPLKHVWQEDLGFRAAASRNNAAKKSKGDYLIYLDGDCVPRVDFVSKHRKLAERGFFVTGNRILLSESLTKSLVEDENQGFFNKSFFSFFAFRLNKAINRLAPLLFLPSSIYQRKRKPRDWSKLRSCNFGIWKKDLSLVNGFNEDFVGWGFEDSELAVRLINRKIYRKSGNFATGVFHLFHQELKIPKEGHNWDLLMNAINQKLDYCHNGLKRA